jgi:hypothetical protein
MRNKIKEVLDALLKKIGSKDIPPLAPVPIFSFAAEDDWEMPAGDIIMTARHQPNLMSSRQGNLFGELAPWDESTILSLPLIDRATEWGISVRAVPGNEKFYGCYCLSQPRQILVASPEPIIFYHELTHAAHEKVIGHLVPWQSPRQEIVAGLCAQVISEIVDGEGCRFLGNTYRLIATHSFTLKVSPLAGCWQFLPEVHHAIRIILSGEDTNHF